ADLDDAREAGLLNLSVLREEVPAFRDAYARVDAEHPSAREKLKFNEALKGVLDSLATDLILATDQRLRAYGPRSVEDIRIAPNRLAGFSEGAAERNGELKRFLFAHIYNHPTITEDRDQSVHCLEELFRYYFEVPGSMPAAHEEIASSTPRHVAVCDYVAGMTDQFLLRQHAEHFPV